MTKFVLSVNYLVHRSFIFVIAKKATVQPDFEMLLNVYLDSKFKTFHFSVFE